MSTAVRYFDRVWKPGEIAEAIGDDEGWRRYEIVDGVLVVSPPPSPRHDLTAVRIVAAIASAVPPGFVATSGVGMELGGSYRITDATVVTTAYIERGGLAPAGDVLLAVEVESRSSITTDRITKPAQYAAAGIRHFWRVELEPLRLNAYRLDGDSYGLVGSWGVDETAVVAEPFEVSIEMVGLLP